MMKKLYTDRPWLQLKSRRDTSMRLFVSITSMPFLIAVLVPPVGYEAKHICVCDTANDIHSHKTIGFINQMGALDKRSFYFVR